MWAVSGLAGPSNGFTPPTVTNSPAILIQTTGATLGGQVLSTGGDVPSVTIYYGTTDGGTNTGSWAQSTFLGLQSGAFTKAITGLALNTTYYFTAKAINSAGLTWATPSQSFTTLSPTVATITNVPASSVLANMATLSGQVLSTGGDTPNVTLFYGPADGGANPAAWAQNIAVGLQSGGFSLPVSGLSSNTAYFFTARAVNAAGTAWAAPSLSFTTPATNPVSTAVSVLTYHNDNMRLGVNTNETMLTLANVNTNSFGKLFSYSLDGFVYAQPLVVPSVNIPGRGVHNVVYIATQHDSVYAFDADSSDGLNASPLWHVSFLGTGVTTVPSGDVGSSDITPEVGITATPVIDPVSGTIYIEAKTKENGSIYVHRLHALDLATGLEKAGFNSPAVIGATNYPGTGSGGGDTDGTHVLWNPLRQLCRPALTLLNGQIYLAYASHGDSTPYHGWLFAYNATNLTQQLAVYNSTPFGGLGGFWAGGGGPSVDPAGNLYLQTGNGSFNASGGTFSQAANNFAMSVLKFSTTNGLSLVDYFAPSNAVALSGADQDLGSSAALALPDSAGSAAHPHLVVGGGKTAPIYLMDRDNLGKFTSTTSPDNIVQQFNGGPGGDRDTTPAYFNNRLYIIGPNSTLCAYSITNAQFNTTPVQTPDGYNNKGGATVCLSANGSGNAIAWAIYNDGGETPATPCILRAYNATNLAQKLYSSDLAGTRDVAPGAVKFIVPTIANGKVYVAAQYSLAVYGLASAFVNPPLISPNGGVYTNSVTVTLSDATVGATIYYTLDGSTPTTNSIQYTVPFVLTNSVAVTAGAFKPGAVSSGTSSASFINSSSIGTGIGLTGAYYSNQLMTYTGPPTLVRTDAVVNFNWGNGSPDPSISVDHFTVRWTGAVQPQFNETYTFYTTTDDGVRVWVNNQLIIDHFVDQGPTEWSGTIALLPQERYNIRMDYYENGGGAQASLSWSSPSTVKAIIPQSQLYAVSNPPPVAVLMSPTNGATFAGTASLTVSATAAAQFNPVSSVNFYANSTLIGSVASSPYTLTTTGLGQGTYAITAVASDPTGLMGTSAPVNITVTAGSGLPYGLTTRGTLAPFLNLPGTINGTLPALLSQTGVFTNTPNMNVAGGFVSYNVNVPLWSDAAVKTRWLGVPNNGAPYSPSQQVGFAATGEWTFPTGTIFVKHFALVTDETNPNTPPRRLETRLLVRDPNGGVYGVTYKWRPDNTDADLLSGSLSENITITNASGTRTQTWYYPSPSDCLLCHTPAANYVLGIKTRQLNGNFTYPATGQTDNELRTLNRLGLLNPAINETNIPNFTQMVAVTNQAALLVDRARSYIDANCAQCHRPGGSGPTIDARYDTPLTNQNIINAILAKANLNDPNTRVVVPDDVWRSLLWVRMGTTDSLLKMPPLARNLVDTNAVQVIGEWINSLSGVPALAPPVISPNGGTYNDQVNVSIASTNAVANYYYTLDSTLPTTNSFFYAGPFAVTSNVIVTASAFASGYNNSFAATAAFNILPQLQFTSGSYLANGRFMLQLSGVAGDSYVLQASTNLVNWSSLYTNVAPANAFSLTDTNAANYPLRFYRVLQLP